MSKRNQTRNEELSNGLSHALGVIAAIVGTPFLIIQAVEYGDTGFIVGVSIFCATMIMLYLSSTFYHLMPRGKAKEIFHIIDHSAIFLLIAGTYTPFTLGPLRGTWGWTLFGLTWLIALIGVVLKVTQKMSHPIISTGLYLVMGWLIIIAIKPLVAALPVASLVWLVAGGLAYSLGVIFYALDSRIVHGHFIWHLFVITGTLSHYFSIYLSVA